MLKPHTFANQDARFSGLVPEGWAEARPGEFKRGASEADPTALIQVGVPGLPVGALVELLLPELGLQALPEPAGL